MSEISETLSESSRRKLRMGTVLDLTVGEKAFLIEQIHLVKYQEDEIEKLETTLKKLDDEYQKDIASAEGAKRSYKKQRDLRTSANIQMRNALKFYADEISYKDYDEWSPGTSDVMSDYGRKARTALESESK